MFFSYFMAFFYSRDVVQTVFHRFDSHWSTWNLYLPSHAIPLLPAQQSQVQEQLLRTEQWTITGGGGGSWSTFPQWTLSSAGELCQQVNRSFWLVNWINADFWLVNWKNADFWLVNWNITYFWLVQGDWCRGWSRVYLESNVWDQRHSSAWWWTPGYKYWSSSPVLMLQVAKECLCNITWLVSDSYTTTLSTKTILSMFRRCN